MIHAASFLLPGLAAAVVLARREICGNILVSELLVQLRTLVLDCKDNQMECDYRDM